MLMNLGQKIEYKVEKLSKEMGIDPYQVGYIIVSKEINTREPLEREKMFNSFIITYLHENRFQLNGNGSISHIAGDNTGKLKKIGLDMDSKIGYGCSYHLFPPTKNYIKTIKTASKKKYKKIEGLLLCAKRNEKPKACFIPPVKNDDFFNGLEGKKIKKEDYCNGINELCPLYELGNVQRVSNDELKDFILNKKIIDTWPPEKLEEIDKRIKEIMVEENIDLGNMSSSKQPNYIG
ncbi:MAG: hypothetical protein KAT37_02005 [Candidatus Aenigmarchaeota archaeon]|nr:hypothetical protein [Candidatus Aenigmarchaeota archaeon]